jgi:hypothetical protein
MLSMSDLPLLSLLMKTCYKFMNISIKSWLKRLVKGFFHLVPKNRGKSVYAKAGGERKGFSFAFPASHQQKPLKLFSSATINFFSFFHYFLLLHERAEACGMLSRLPLIKNIDNIFQMSDSCSNRSLFSSHSLFDFAEAWLVDGVLFVSCRTETVGEQRFLNFRSKGRLKEKVISPLSSSCSGRHVLV